MAGILFELRPPSSGKMAEEFDPAVHSHRHCKFDHSSCSANSKCVVDNPLTGEWVLVSDPHRMKHPWNGQVETPQTISLPKHDPDCYLCSGNQRASGQQNVEYEHTKVFPNDYASVLPPPHPVKRATTHPLLASEPVVSACDVLIFHPRHDLTLARLSLEDIARIIDEWTSIHRHRGSQASIEYVQIFEVPFHLLRLTKYSYKNKNAMMGCSNPHPHGQIWALSHIPTLAATELASLARNAACYAVNPDVGFSKTPRGPFWPALPAM